MSLALTFARRELRSGVAGFRVFLACLALGVAALAAAGSTAEAFRQGLASQSRSILGGDVAASIEGRRFTPAERAAFARLGATTDAVRIRAMAEGAGGARRLADVRGVDSAFPLAGAVTLSGAPDLGAAIRASGSAPGAAVDGALMDRLGLKLGDTVLLGDSRFTVRARLISEPDTLGRGFALAPSIIVDRSVLERSGLMEADALFGETIRIALNDSAQAPDRVLAGLAKQFPGAGLRLRGRNDAAAGLKRLIDQLEFFLSFIGLSSLLAGGLGVSTAVTSYLEARKPSIAVLKVLGARSSLVRDVFLIQIGALALLGVAIGLAFGAASPFLLGWIAKDRLPVPVLFSLYPRPLALAGLFGLLAAAAFSLGPLARARATPPASLFRKDMAARAGFGVEAVGQGLAALGLVALTLVLAPSPTVAAVMVVAIVAAFGLLQLIGLGAMAGAARLRGLTSGTARLGLANLAGPGSAARTATPSIGLGVALLTAVLLIQSSLIAQVRVAAPQAAPSLILTQVPPERAADLDALMARIMGPLSPDRYRRMPFATGRIVGVKGAPVDIKRIDAGMRWAFDQDLSLSTLAAAPSDADLVAGAWWAENYAGPPQVILDRDIARGAGVRVGDTLTLSILGRAMEARVAGLRKVDLGHFGASFPIIIDPAALAGANLREIVIAKTAPSQDPAILAALGRDLPQVNVISVREELEAAAKIFDQLAWAVRGAAAVAGLAGLLVLVGAIAASSQARAREAAILKVLGSTRGQILAAYLVEYGLVGAIAATAGILLGAAAAYPVVAWVFHSQWSVDWSGLATLLAAVAMLSTLGGLVSALFGLSRRPAPVLRGE